MPRQTSTIITVTALLLSLSGCMGTMGDTQEGIHLLQGRMGEVEFEGGPEVRSVRVTDSEIYIDLRMQDIDGNWAVMAGMHIPRDIDLEVVDEETGYTQLALRAEDSTMIGCSGESDGNWEFDCRPTDVEIEVLETDGTLSVDFKGTFTAEDCRNIDYDEPPAGHSVEGSVDVDLI